MLLLLSLLVGVNVLMCGVMAVQAWRYARRVGEKRNDEAAISILVPAEADDPAVARTVAALEAAPWKGPKQVLVCGPGIAGEPPPLTNRKAHYLAVGARYALHNVVVTVDSRVVVEADTLPRLVGHVEGTTVAAVASSVAVPDGTLLRALCAHLARGHAHAWPVLAGLSWTLGDAPPVAGSLMAIRADVLRAVGSFEAVRDTIADDLALTEALKRYGDVVLTPVEARVMLGNVSWAAWFERWVRWIKVGTSHAPWRATSYALLLAPLPLAVALAGASGDPRAWALVGALVVARLLLGLSRKDLASALGPVADFALFLAAGRAGLSRNATWRGHTYGLGPFGRLMAPQKGVPPVLFGILGLLALFGLGYHLDDRVSPFPAWAFLAMEGVLVAGVLRDPVRILGVMAIGFGAEVLGVHTGYPFSEYRYLDTLGPTVGGVPLVMGPTWLVVTTTATAWARGRWWLALPLLVAFDVVLDPLAAGPLGYWAWPDGDWYGVPWENFVGWAVVGAPLVWVLRDATRWEYAVVGWINLVFFTALAIDARFWGCVAVAAGIGAAATWPTRVPASAPPEPVPGEAR